MAALVRLTPLDDRDLDGLGARAAELESSLQEHLAAIERVGLEVAAFTIMYRQRVGLLHDELDALESAIAEAELGERAERAQRDAARGEEPAAATRCEPLPRYTTDAVRKLFRDVAKAIHPDLAEDEATRSRRHALMIEANRAYSLGDEERLRSILQSWDQRPEAVQGDDPDAMRARLVRRIAEIEEHLAMALVELGSLKDSPMWKLKVMVDETSGRGKDLVRDMVVRLKRDILVARNRLDAMRSVR